MTTIYNTTLRYTSGPCSQHENVPTMAKHDMLHLQAPTAATGEKAGTFGLLSVCASKRVPSRGSLRSCTVNMVSPTCAVDHNRDPWALKPRRSSQARMEHTARSRVRSILVPSAIPSSEFQQHLLSVSKPPPSASVPQTSAPSLCTSALSPVLPRSSPLPVVSTLGRPSPSESRRPSLMARARRVPSSSRYPPIDVSASAVQYTFDIALPIAIKPEMVTITTAKGDKLKIVADAWHLEADCHYEWEILFRPQDVDMSAIRAKFDVQGRLTISASRLSCNN